MRCIYDLAVRWGPRAYPIDRPRESAVLPLTLNATVSPAPAVQPLLCSKNWKTHGNGTAPIYAELLGWGQSSDGYNIMAPEPNGEGLARAIRSALSEAQLAPGDIDYVNAHATATPLGDVAEIRAIQGVFTNNSPWISSLKSQTGHGLSMAGALETGICALALREKFTPVSMKITELDPVCAGSRIVTQPIDHAPRTILKNSSAFGGANVVLALRRFEN